MIWSRNQQTPGPETSTPVIELQDPIDLAPHVAGAEKTVVFFEMSGCPYCIACRSRFADLVRERAADLRFVRVILDDPRNPLWQRYDIHAVPTVIAFTDGEPLTRADAALALGLSKKKWLDFCAGV